MKTYKVTDIMTNLEIFLDDEIEAENEYEAKDEVLNEILDNLGNYIEIELEEIN